MAAPSPTTRTPPSGWLMPEGFKALLTLGKDADISIWEIETGTPVIDGGDAIEITNQHNTAWTTARPRQLKTLGAYTVKAAYDPDYLPDILNAINREDTITIRNPNGSTDCHYGYLQKFERDPYKIGEFPTGTFTIMPTNWDYVNKVEAGPVHTPAAGT